MPELTPHQRSFLEGLFGTRVNFDKSERKLYGHDIGSIPKLVKPLIRGTTPRAVVQPETEEEIAGLVRWARPQGIPLVARGKATSGYGGVVPTRNDIVVDFYRMREVLEVDEEGLTVRVQPGITWERLDRALSDHGLTLRLYPSSYPSSTAGGWLAQGGAGFGSYEYGYFGENVVSARVVLPTGEVMEMSGKELDLVSEAEGTTGFISEMVVKVKPAEGLGLAAFACRDEASLQRMLSTLAASDLELWSVMFVNPRMAAMRNTAASARLEGCEDFLRLPEAYIVTCAYRGDDVDADVRLRALAAESGAEVLPGDIAEHEWENRFRIMLVKRLGPSLVPAEVVLPLGELGAALRDINGTVRHPVLKEGIIVRTGEGRRPEAVLLGFIPADERKFSYHFMFGLSLSVMKAARSHGGRPYATGLYFSGKADDVLGTRKVADLRVFKEKHDPGRLVNPGKVIDRSLVSRALDAAMLTEPLLRPVANLVASRVGERPGGPERGVPGDVAWYAYSCSQCGYCLDECPEFAGRGWESASPRGKWYWLRAFLEGRANWDQKMVDSFLVCTTCETCNLRCSEGLPVEESWMKMRGRLIDEEKRMTFPPFEMMAAALKAQGDIWAGYRKDRDRWFPADMLEKHGPGTAAGNVYFAGCTASYVENDIAMATVRLLDAAGVDFSYLGVKENCCATPMLVAGKWDVFADTMRKNIQAVKEAGGDTVISSCPACDMMWRKVYPEWAGKLGIDYGIKAKHYSEVIAERIAAGELSFPGPGEDRERVTFHDSCHIGRASGVYEPPRDLIRAVPGAELVEMEHNRDEALCCGSVLTLIKEPPVAAEIGKTRLEEAIAAGADRVVALCPCCEFQLRVAADRKGVPIEVVDLARFTASALGHDFPDPHEEVMAQWAVFEAMIELMTPQGFAELMGTMLPELVDAMPLKMGAMMRLAGKVPGVLEAMKPMFPILFPRLLPLMMPKVMPVMLERVAERVPMPGYMKEQMPDLMPLVMDNLMPHMIGDVVPLVTRPLIGYLRGRTG